MLKNEAAHRCTNVRNDGIRRLRPCSSDSDVKVTTPSVRLATRMLNGGISSSAIFIIGQVIPQPRQRRTRKTRALIASAVAGMYAVILDLIKPARVAAYARRSWQRAVV